MSGTSVVSMAAAGLLADRVRVQGAFLVGGVVCLAAGLLGFVLYPRNEEAAAAERAVPNVEVTEPSS
jgi:hypothetical protein